MRMRAQIALGSSCCADFGGLRFPLQCKCHWGLVYTTTIEKSFCQKRFQKNTLPQILIRAFTRQRWKTFQKRFKRKTASKCFSIVFVPFRSRVNGKNVLLVRALYSKHAAASLRQANFLHVTIARRKKCCSVHDYRFRVNSKNVSKTIEKRFSIVVV